jgi:ketosteroid isomerase-like protein
VLLTEEPPMSHTVAEMFVEAIARHDSSALTELLAPDVDFRGLTPRRDWEAHTPAEVVHIVLGNWFADNDHIDAVSRVEHGDPVGDTQRVGYRFEIVNPDGRSTVEQQAYYRLDDGRLAYLRIVCSGFRPRKTAS